MARRHAGRQVGAGRKLRHRVHKNSRLRNVGAAQVLVAALEHGVGEPETEDIIGLLQQAAGGGILLEKLTSHARKLRALTGKNHGLN
jgi:hypothetical protein